MKNAWLSAVVLAAAVAAGSANAAIYVAGGGFARSCYNAAANGRDDLESLRVCNMALSEEALIQRNRAATYANRGIVYLNRNDAQLALADFDRAAETMPNLAEVHLNRGAALLNLTRYQEAIAAADHSLTLHPDEPEKAYFIRAAAHEELGDVEAAYRDYARAAELAPEWNVARAELARFRVR